MKGVGWIHGIVIEIGAHNIPIEGIRSIYVDRFFEFAGSKCIVDIVRDAIDFQKNNFKMPIQNSYKFSKLGFKTVKFNI